ncbi:MAG TPA: 3D-(3,5/4)-trihydroxycyclohexane-1,2-dione acylhydrolase (decyclizing), partial [Thermomicrobiales bacterium]|nr:3D-(3,5/4)-trihydroxycyclohexane-1,2-dione acylhydrolase (decyclizing) [Thermomicrobiales bacterium]
YRPQNEQAMVHASIAYAKMKNRLQTFACTSSVGPGATNMVTGAATATVNRLPVLLLPGDTFASRLPHPVLQQLEHPMAMDISVNDAFRPVSRFWDRITRPEQLLSSLPEAMRILTDQAETGAVTICLPEDSQTEAYDWPAAFLEERVTTVYRNLPARGALDRAAELIRSAQRPLIIAGGGVIYSEATAELANFAERFGIPVCETQAGKGSLPWNHPLNVGPIGANGGLSANRLAAQSDLVLLIGTRFADFTTASRTAFQNPDVRFAAVNVAAYDAHKAGSLPLIGDARATIEALGERLSASGFTTVAAYGDEVERLKNEWDRAVDSIRAVTDPNALNQANVIGIVNEASGPNDVVVCAAGGLPGDLLKLWRPVDPKGYHLEYGYSCMGYEIAGGLGVKMAAPDREVFVMVGDGSYLMLHTEIVTSIQEGRKIVIVLLDNGGFGCIRGLQMANGTPSFGTELRFRDESTGQATGPNVPVDFARNAESLGARSIHVRNERELRQALEQAKQADRTTLISIAVPIDVQVPGFESWWDVPVAEVTDEASVEAARDAYEEQRKKQRVFV